mmetsp:Transcript_28048/g.39948  ORF Transcript_28048/g.39948 Transcript_28048/m.39948 type:complete len:392 (-) Transcript_28048:1159-2334(-)
MFNLLKTVSSSASENQVEELVEANALGVVGHAHEVDGLALLVDSAVDVLVQPVVGRELACLGGGQRGLHGLVDFLLDLLELVRSGQAVVHQQLLHVVNGVPGRAHAAHLLAGAVGGARVGHGVAVVAIRVELHEHGSVAAGAVLAHHGHALTHRQHVHAVHADAGDRAAAHRVVQVVAGRAVRGRAHAVVVVLDGEHHRQAPQLAHVGGLPDLALVGGPVSVAGDGDGHLLALGGVVLGCEGQSCSYRHLSPNDALSSEKVVLLGIKVHRPTFPLRSALRISEKLRKNLLHSGSPQQRNTMAAIGGDPRILSTQCGMCSRCNSFLAIIKMTKSTNISGLVFSIIGNFHSPHSVHFFHITNQLILCSSYSCRRGVYHVCRKNAGSKIYGNCL